MQPFRLHVFVCDQQKPEGLPCCSARGSAKVIDVLRREVAARGLGDDVQITACGSLGLCERGPNMVVYPEGVWYSGVQPQDVAEIVESHFQKGQVVERLANKERKAVYEEIRTNRDKFLAGMKARDAAGIMPDDLAQTIRGFQESRVILTAVELDLFTAVGQGSSAAAVASRIGTDERATEMLMNALASMELLNKRDSTFYNSPLAARFFVEGSPDDSRAARSRGAARPRHSTRIHAGRCRSRRPRA